MKNLAKIFMAVAVALFAFSCVQDATEDLGVSIEGQGVKELTLSLEESRTQLGEKADGIYPLYWSEGDKISVNGVESAEAVIGANASTATFAVDVVADELCVVYPATEGTGEGTTFPVNFLAEQAYTEGTFANGAAPMYGYAANASTPIELKHLAGALRLAVTGNGEAITKVVAKAENGNIAGAFTVDCANGTLTAGAEASNTVTVTFAEPLVLGAEAQHIYLAVPAGSYGQFTLTLHTATDKMVVKFDSEAKPISAGNVREFKEITYAATPAGDESTIFEIDGKDALIEFASIASTFAPYVEAKVVAEIDMTGVEWTPIEGFGEFTFDGGDFAIKGLNAPLFGTTSATIKNVKLTDVAMTSNGLLHFGAIACHLTNNTACNNTLTNCEVSGAITISNPEFTPEANYSSVYDVVACAGVAGYIFGVPVSNCVNRVNVTVAQIAKEGSATTFCPAIGGIAGYVHGSEDTAKTSISNCVNYGAVAYNDNATARCLRPIVAGIVAFGTTDNATSITNCVNRGPISLNALTYGSTGAGAGEYIGGITGRVTLGTITSCKNEATGTITVDGDLTSPCIGGIAGYTNNTTTTLCDNLGAIEMKATSRFMGLMVGGVTACSYDDANGTGYMEQCTNDGSIKLLGSTREGATAPENKAYYYRVGGISGFPRHAVTNCENKANGDILIEGNIVNMTTNTEVAINISAGTSYLTQGAATYITNRGDLTVNAHFSLNQTLIDDKTTGNQPLNIASLVCYDTYNPHHLENYGNISFGGSFTGYRAFIGGLVADGFNQNICPNDSTNHGSITIEESAVFDLGNYLYIGGIIAITERNKSDVANMTNNGAINFNGTMANGSLRLGGYSGYVKSYFSNVTNNAPITFGAKSTVKFTQVGGLVGYFAKGTSGTCSNLINTELGDITLNGTLNGSLRVSGCIADKVVYGHTIDNCVNSGDITVNSSIVNPDGILTIGGNLALMSAGSGATDKMPDTFSNFTNNGKITLNNITCPGATRIGGCVGSGDVSDELVLTDCTNNGPISVTGTYTAADGDNNFNVAGIAGLLQGKNSGHSNLLNSETGDITVNVTTTKCKVRIAGIAGKIQDGTTGLTNKGDISVSGSIAGEMNVTGIIALTNGYNRSNVLNEGNITISASGSNGYFGGIYNYGAWEYGQTNVVNKGNLTVTKDATFTGSVYMGGLIGLRTNKKKDSGQPFNLKEGCYNSGNLTFNGTCGAEDVTSTSAYNKTNNLYMGGLAGQSRYESTSTESYAIRADGFTNKGNITFGGKVVKGGAYIGGIMGDVDQPMSATYWTGTIINVGDITCTGTYKTVGYVGGLFGEAAKTFANGKCYCSIDAAGYTGVGMITGSTYSTAVAMSNCHIGGSIKREMIEDVDSSGEVEMVPGPVVTLDASNYYKYVYANEVEEGIVTTAGGSFLTEKPEN